MKSNDGNLRSLVFGLSLVLTLAIVPLVAQTRGMIMDNNTGKAVVFNADADTVTGAVTIGFGAVGDCSITLDQAFGFATRFNSNVYVIQLSPPALAGGINPIPISNAGEDTSLSPNGKQVVVCDGSGGSFPVSVVDVASHVQLTTLSTGSPDCNSVDVAKTGSVLVTSPTDDTVRRLTIDGAGSLTNTGEVLAVGGQPNNVVAAPDGGSGVVIDFSPATIKSFKVPGLTPVSTVSISSNGISGAFNNAGTVLYVRDLAHVTAFSYAPGTGAIGGSLFSIPIASSAPIFFGMDQMALHPNGSKLYVSQPGAVNIYNATTGAPMGSITSAGNISGPTGICLPGCTAPVISAVTVSKSSLWPPNHEMVDITVGYTNSSNCPSSCKLSVTSNEPIDGLGDGDTSPDWVVVDATHVQLRAERSGLGTGRIYTITITCTNSAGQSSTATATVTVPHDQR